MHGVNHYENFPVASWLCPAPLRPAVQALYRFARTADDLADEGDAPSQARLDDLRAYRAELVAACQIAAAPAGRLVVAGRWPEVFAPLAEQIHQQQLPAQPLHDLLDAFEQDVRYTRDEHRYADMDELLDYCRRSANPVGRLLLHLYGVQDASSLEQSDAICSALQLINFWQDLGVDIRRGRHYLPADALQRHGVRSADLLGGQPSPAAQALVLELCQHARSLMLTGAPLAWRLRGRIGWELRLVVHGGLRILDKIAAMQGRTWLRRPRLTPTDVPVLLWRALQPAPAPSSPFLHPLQS